MATIGQVLTSPESGWTRFDRQAINSNVNAAPGYSKSVDSVQFYITPSAAGGYINFYFYGKSIRLGTYLYPSSRSNSIEVMVDGTSRGTYNGIGTAQSDTLIFEYEASEEKTHFVQITAKTAGDISLTWFDIKSQNAKITPDFVVNNIKDLVVGSKIRCAYTAGSGVFGSFSDLGLGQNSLISATSSATPNGDFNFVTVEDQSGKKKLIADRNIQHSISWDTLNAALLNNNKYTHFVLLNIMTNVIVYVDAVNGDDTNGDGTATRPFQTFTKAATIKTYKYGDIIFLKEGNYTYNHSGNSVNLPHVIGQNNKVVLEASSSTDWTIGLNFYPNSKIVNVIFKQGASASTNSYLLSAVGTSAASVLNFYNCVFDNWVRGYAVITYGKCNFNNCFVKYGISYYSGSSVFYNSVWSGGNTNNGCLALTSVTYDSTTYALTSNNWANLGLGTNPDGTKANIGLYGGIYAWGFNLDFLKEKFTITISLLSGGTSSTDTNNDWDNYVVNSNLNGTTTPGNNSTWNWNGIFSLTSSVNTASSPNKTTRGSTTVSNMSSTASSGVSSTIGFRPMITIEGFKYFKHLIQDNSNLFNINLVTNTLNSVGTQASKQNFDSFGMDDLTQLGRSIKTITRTYSNNETLGNGKKFKYVLDIDVEDVTKIKF